MVSDTQVRLLRIVVASPGDVQTERDVLPEVLSELNLGVAADRCLRLELCRWETDAYPGFHPEGPQGLIDPILKIEDCDILVGIFWKRFGTPVGNAKSGTEHEFRLAYEAWTQKQRPHIQVYFNQKAYTPKNKEETDQWGQVLEFKKQFPKEGLWWHYKGKIQFERLVRNHLTQFLRNRSAAFGPTTAGNSPSETPVHEPTTWPRYVSEVICAHVKVHIDPRGTAIRRNLLIFETEDQRTWLSFTSAGLLCILDNRRKGGKMSVKWFTPLDDLRSAKIETTRNGQSKESGLLRIGERHDWLFTRRLFKENLPLKQIIQEEIRKLP
jgi:hypothetical protein